MQIKISWTNMNMMRVLQEHNRSFINWFRKTIFANDSCSKTLSLLAVGPNLNSGVSIDAHSQGCESHQEC